ncbi:MAG: ROK family protein [Bryobacterales bacterium]|nr:ROK family protein [Bryobacterales bacterium]
MSKTLSIDIGGSKVKAMVLDEAGQPVSSRERMKTPQPATPKAILAVIEELAAKLGGFDRISTGFPGAVRHGVIETAPNLDPLWKQFHLADELSALLKRPARVANDATVQGFGAISGKGVELVITLGTGLGSALFIDGISLPNLELAHHPFRASNTYEELLGQKALEREGKKKWNKQLQKAIEQLFNLFYYDRLLVGGGNAEHIDFKLPESVHQIPNIAGIIGGVALWDSAAIGAVTRVD